jgi:hypothetical protein
MHVAIMLPLGVSDATGIYSVCAAGFPEKVVGAAAYPGDLGVDRLRIYGTIVFDYHEDIRTGGRLKVCVAAATIVAAVSAVPAAARIMCSSMTTPTHVAAVTATVTQCARWAGNMCSNCGSIVSAVPHVQQQHHIHVRKPCAAACLILLAIPSKGPTARHGGKHCSPSVVQHALPHTS